MKHLIALALSALALTSSTAAFACKPAIPCKVESITGEIPCVEANINSGCIVGLKWSCGEAAGEVTLTRDDGLSVVLSAANPETSATLGDDDRPTTTTTTQTNISWSSAEQSGVITVEYAERASGVMRPSPCSAFNDDDASCAVSAPQNPAAPLTALLPLLLGALMWRRRRDA
jgi:MYXO-CTERM domain-containing protein